MFNFEIIPDSSSDLSRELRERFDIKHVIEGTVYTPEGKQILADLDWETMSPEEFYNSMKGRKILYKTATPPIGNVISTFESVLKEGKDVLCIALSSGLSSTIDVFRTAAQELKEKYPDRKIICVDSLRYSAATSLLVAKGSEKRASGATIEETADYLNEIKHCIHQMGPLDDLFFCVKTGRITNFQAFFGTLVGINSLGDFSVDGKTTVVGKAKGRRSALDATVNYIKKTIINPEDQIIFVSHSDRPEVAKILKERIESEIHPKEIIMARIGMSCGCAVGPGLCAAYYIGAPINGNEKDIMDTLIKETK